MKAQEKRPLHVGIIGLGYAALTFHIPLIEACEGLRLRAISSRDLSKCPEPLRSLRLYETPDTLIADQDLDLIVIPTPNETHFPLSLMALRAGHHVVVDKPFCLTVAEAKTLMAEAQVRSLCLSVFHNRRYDDDFLSLQKALKTGRLGRVVEVNSYFNRFRPKVRDRWREGAQKGAGIWYDLGPHLLDQALCLWGKPSHIDLRLQALRDGALSDDAFVCHLSYPRLNVTLKASCLAADHNLRFLVHGTESSLRFEGLDPQEAQLKSGLSPLDPQFGLRDQTALWITSHDMQRHCEPLSLERGRYIDYYQGLAAALSLGQAPPVSADQALEVMQLLEAGLQSHSLGQKLPLN